MADDRELHQVVIGLQWQIAELIATMQKLGNQNAINEGILLMTLARIEEQLDRLEEQYKEQRCRVTPEDFRILQDIIKNAERTDAEDIERRKRLGIDD